MGKVTPIFSLRLSQVETDKATVSFDSTEDGYLAKILVKAGTTDVKVGTPVAIIVTEKEDVAAFANYSAGGAPAAAAAAPAAKAAPAAAAAPAAPAAPAAAPAPAAAAAPAAPSGGRVFASPAARKLAAERGIDVASVPGTGPERRVVKADVAEFVPVAAAAPAVKAAAAPATAAPSSAPSPASSSSSLDYEDIPLSNVRKVIASRLSQSKQTIPHYYITVDVQMDAILKLRTEMNNKLAAEKSATKLSVNDFVIKAAAAALRKVPDVNASWRDSHIRKFNYVDVSVAVSTDSGLITPIVKDADLKGLCSISGDMKDLATRARANKLAPSEFQGGTFTVSNLGMFGVKQFSAIINPPQAAILAVGATETRVVPNTAKKAEHDSPFKTVQMMSVTASFDHRVVDGATGAQWLAAFKGYCEDPVSMLM